MKTTKKIIVAVLIALGFILLLADTDRGFTYLVAVKIFAFAMLFGGIQLSVSWQLFNEDNDE